MPVEIRELVIKAIIVEGCNSNRNSSGVCQDDKEIMIAECVERTLQILKEKEER